MRIAVFVIIVLCSGSHCLSQNVDLWQQMKTQFPDASALFVARSEVLNISIEGDSLRVRGNVFEDILHLKEQTDGMASTKIYGSHFTQVGDFKAKTLVWDKNRYKEINVTSFKKNSDRDRGIFYDDSYNYSFDFPAVAARNRTQLQYTENQKDAKFIPGYIFASYIPAAKTSFTIKTTKDVELVYKVLNDPKNLIKFNKIEKGKNVTYEWTVENILAFKNEEGSPAVRYFAPHLVCYVKSYQVKNKKINVLSGISDLYNWYNGFTKDLNTDNSEALTAVVADIMKESKSELETVKNVFYWVQENIQYIAFEQGMRGLIPHHGSYVCEKRYGDCKDMANLIVNMLQIAGIKGYHTWIGTRDLPYKYSELPTPLVDNHMIATYISKDKQYYFLDATSDYTPFGYPSSMIQGKEALIGKSATEFEIQTVPELDKEMNIMTDSMKLKLNGHDIVGTGSSSLTGYAKVFAGYELDRAETEDVKQFVTSLVGKGSNKFYLDSYKVSHLDDHSKPTSIKYDFRISDYHKYVDSELYINLNLNKEFYNNLINISSRKTPKELDYKYIKFEYIEFSIPSGYTIEYLPENGKHDGKYLGFDISYQVKGDKVLFYKKISVNYLLLQPTEFASWNESVKLISEAYKESIILKKINQ